MNLVREEFRLTDDEIEFTLDLLETLGKLKDKEFRNQIKNTINYDMSKEYGDLCIRKQILAILNQLNQNIYKNRVRIFKKEEGRKLNKIRLKLNESTLLLR